MLHYIGRNLAEIACLLRVLQMNLLSSLTCCVATPLLRLAPMLLHLVYHGFLVNVSKSVHIPCPLCFSIAELNYSPLPTARPLSGSRLPAASLGLPNFFVLSSWEAHDHVSLASPESQNAKARALPQWTDSAGEWCRWIPGGLYHAISKERTLRN